MFVTVGQVQQGSAARIESLTLLEFRAGVLVLGISHQPPSFFEKALRRGAIWIVGMRIPHNDRGAERHQHCGRYGSSHLHGRTLPCTHTLPLHLASPISNPSSVSISPPLPDESAALASPDAGPIVEMAPNVGATAPPGEPRSLPASPSDALVNDSPHPTVKQARAPSIVSIVTKGRMPSV